LNHDPHELYATALRAHVRHLVLYRDSIDRVEGVLDVRHYLLDPGHRVQPAWHKPLFIPEACPLDRLLTQFLQERRRVAVVVDEYGGTAGVVTRGDILEEIVGEIDDELAEHKHVFDVTGSDRWLLDGQISLEQINQELNLHLEAEGADRMAGWIAARLERLPRPGDTVTAQGCRAVVQQMRRHRITLVQLERLAPADEHAEHPEETGA
jgi:putative hemolysin